MAALSCLLGQRRLGYLRSFYPPPGLCPSITNEYIHVKAKARAPSGQP